VVTDLEQVFRDQWGRVLAALIGFLGDFDLAEEAAQEAFAIAAERWPRDGIPSSPGSWLITTGRNRAIDRIRRDRTFAARTHLLQGPEATEDRVDPPTFPDERLELAFTCCHPALATDAQVAGLRPATPTGGRWRWSTTTPSGACSSGGWRTSARRRAEPAPPDLTTPPDPRAPPDPATPPG
jgi:hypothetical protein